MKELSEVTCNNLTCMLSCESSGINSNVEFTFSYDYEVYALIDAVEDLEKEMEKLKSNILSKVSGAIGLDKTCSMSGQFENVDGNIVSLYYTDEDVLDAEEVTCLSDYDDPTTNSTTCFPYHGNLIARYTENLTESNVANLLESIVQTGMESNLFITPNMVKLMYFGNKNGSISTFSNDASNPYDSNIDGGSQLMTNSMLIVVIISFVLGSGFVLKRFKSKMHDGKQQTPRESGESHSPKIGRNGGLQSYDCNNRLDESSDSVKFVDPYESSETGHYLKHSSKTINRTEYLNPPQDLCTITEVSKETDSSSKGTSRGSSAGIVARMVDTDSMESFSRILSESTYSDRFYTLGIDNSSICEL